MKKVYLILLILLASINVFANDAIKLIVNKNVNIETISRVDVEKIYLGKKTTWSNGSKIIPVMMDKNDLHDEFTKTVVKKSSSQFSAFWKQAIFTGKGTPPKSFNSESELAEFVSNTPGAVGYISASATVDNVKTVAIEQ